MKRRMEFDDAIAYYGAQKAMGASERSSNRLLFLRNFNNWVKSSLINDYAVAGMSVFDLCCGKGGDLFKWKLAQCGHYVGLDLFEQQIDEAVNRFMSGGGQKMFPAIFIKNADVSSDKLNVDSLLPKQIVFDVVSCQMSMHYAFKSETSVRNFLSTVTCRLATGGYFIGTVPDADVLLGRFSLSSTFGNEFYSIEGLEEWREDSFTMKYQFYLEDAVGFKGSNGKHMHVPEYLVIFDKFQKIAKEFDLELVKRWNFKNFEEQHTSSFNSRKVYSRKVKGRAEDTEEAIEKQKEIIYMYQAFCFQKKGKMGKLHNACGYCGCQTDPLIIDAKCGITS